MALANPLITVQDGPAAVASALAANATAFVTPGNAVTFSLTSTTGVQTAQFVIVAPGTPLDGLRSPQMTGTSFSWTVLMPPAPANFTITAEVTDGFNPSYNSNAIVSGPATRGAYGNTHSARNVVITNQAALATYTVAAAAQNDNVAGGNVQGDYVLLVNQTTGQQNGLYVVGVVGGGTAPLTRVPDFATGAVLSAGQKCEIDGGTVFANSTWKVTTLGPITVDTTVHAWFPQWHRFTVAIGTPFVTGWFRASTGAQGTKVLINDQTSTTTGTKVVIVAGSGNGTATASGTGTDSIDCAALNW
jgi:hypothetical protein